jgi:AraC family ethanolamine operon transcriptional activator
MMHHRLERHAAAPKARQEVVERAVAYMRAHRSDPVTVSRLCRVVGLSERSLRNAFYGVRGMGPKQCMLVERLQDVRRALSDSSISPTTVTDIATDHGFYELGRFAAIYKRTFGEAPSETLRGSSRRAVALGIVESERAR